MIRPEGLSEGGSRPAAIRERSMGKVRSLLDAAPDLLHAGDERSNQPIHWAVMTRHGAYPNPEVESSADALSIAIMNSDTKMIDQIADHR